MKFLNSKLLILLIIFLATVPSSAQQNVPYQRLLLLVAGPSGERIDPNEQGVVTYLNQLRGEYQLYNLQMGTMHFDRPREARVLEDNLGFSRNAGVTVGLVQLSDQGIPVRTIYKEEGLTPQTVATRHQSLLTRWADISQEDIPDALRAVASTSGGTQTAPPPPISSTNGTLPPPQKKPLITPEGIKNTIVLLDQKSMALFQNFKNRPIRDDRMDLPLRQATLGLSEAAHALKLSHDRGIVYPIDELARVRAAGREWRLAEPQFYLPVDLRQEVQPLLDLLELMEGVEAQGRELLQL